MTRLLQAGRFGAQRDLQGLIATVLAAEFIAPSQQLWVVAPRLADAGILDNRAGAFRGLDPNWPPRYIRLSEVLVGLLKRRARAVLITEDQVDNHRFVAALQRSARDAGIADALLIHFVEDLPAQGILGDDFVVHGSLTFADDGVRILNGDVAYDINADAINAARAQFGAAYEAVDR